MRLTKTSTKIRLGTVALIASLLLTLLSHERVAFAQGGFEGDYDLSFGGGDGYYVDPQFPDPARSDGVVTQFVTGDMMADGSLVAGGNLARGGGPSDPIWYIKKFLPSGALDTTFNGGKGFITPDFYVLDPNPRSGIAATAAEAEEYPKVRSKHSGMVKLKVLPDNKILVVGICDMSGVAEVSGGTTSSPIIGKAVCMMRFNPNGTLDTTFGPAGEIPFASGQAVWKYKEVPGMVLTPVGNAPNYRTFFETDNLDMTIQPDGKILVAGETRTADSNNSTGGIVSGFLLRYTSQGAWDTGFGQNGAIHYYATPRPGNCTPRRLFFGAAVQPDGRILALGSYGTVDTADCTNRHGNRFVVTRWTANGALETTRFLDNNTTYNNQRERATGAVFTDGGSKVVVSGSYACKETLVKFNVSNLSLDTTFGTGGIAGYLEGCGVSTAPYGMTLNIKAIQPDGKILGIDNPGNPRVVRLNPDGGVDSSFGNTNLNNASVNGALDVRVINFNGQSNPLDANHLIVRPNGRLNLFGQSYHHAGLDLYRAVVSQQNTELPSYTLAGRVLAGSGAAATGVAGVTVKLSGSKTATTTTNSTGNYSFANVPLGGNYTVTPSKPGLSMTPAFKSFNNLSADQLNVNFTVPGLSLNNVTVTEANTGATTTATFTIKLAPASTESVTVKYATANATATAPADYTALPLTTLTFAPGQTSKTVTVAVKGDALDEANETFKLRLSTPTKALISDNEGICTITDNDPLPSITISDARVTEPDSSVVAATFTVRLSAASGRTVSVKYATGGGLSGSIATAGTDYVTVPLTTLTFTPGQTAKTVTVQVKGDTLKEANETFFVNLSGAVNGAITDAKGLGTISNDD